MSKRMIFLIAIAALAAGFVAWKLLAKPDLPAGIASGNGRLEANELFVSAKIPGRVKEVLVDEGDTVTPGQVVARLDTEELEASLRQAEAQVDQARQTERAAMADVQTKRAQLNTRRAEIAEKQADLSYASQQSSRSQGLVKTGAVSFQEAQLDSSQMLAKRAQVAGSRADFVAAQADLAQSQATVGRMTSTIQAASAEADRIRAQIKDTVLVAPIGAASSAPCRTGRGPGAGGRVYSIVDLSDVYMYVFLPESVTGKVRSARKRASCWTRRRNIRSAPLSPYVSPMAQFTPKTVETAEERHNLTFRVKLQIPKERLRQYEALVKTGLPGMGYVRFDNGTQWPATLSAAGQAYRATCGTPPVARRPVMDAFGLDFCASAPGAHPSIRQGRRARQRQPRHSGQQDDRPDRAGRRRQVDPAGHARRRAQDPDRRGRGARRRHRRRAVPQRGLRADRLHAAGPGQEPLSDASDLRERRLLRPAVRPVARGARVADRRAVRTAPTSRRSATGRPASCRAA